MARLNKQAGEILIYDVIGGGALFGGVTPAEVANMLSELGRKDVTIRINSPGGSAFDGLAIYNRLLSHNGRVDVQIDGQALSAASIIAMAGEEIAMALGSQMMIHDPWAVVASGSSDLRKEADRLDRLRDDCIEVYSQRSGVDRGIIGNWMAAETSWNAAEAVEAGMADRIGTTLAVAALKERALFQYDHTPPVEVESVAVEPEDWSQVNKMRRKRVAEIHAQYRHETG